MEPVIVPRSGHPISRRNIDPDALKVLYRLQHRNHAAYLVGGSVRDLLLGRQPKDFDIGTDAHPHQIKRLFKNCWIIGRRFRLAHVKFGPKTIEVATFRKIVPDTPETDGNDPVVVATSPGPSTVEGPGPSDVDSPGPTSVEGAPNEREHAPGHDRANASDRRHTRRGDHGILHRDNTFGTPEEDAFRRDFTVNGLFYDIATRSIIDYVGGLGDLERRVIRSIGDPRVRFVEDPVRMLRAAVFGARLGFDLDALVVEAIAEHRALILKASPSRMMEEFYKILRSGYAEASVRALARVRLLELIAPDLKSPPDAVWDSLARLDRFRQRFETPPPGLSNLVLLGSVLVPLGVPERRGDGQPGREGEADRPGFGMLPVSRKDLDRLRQLLLLLPRLTDPDLPPRVARSMHHRPGFDDAVSWLEIAGDSPDAVEHWKKPRPPRHPHAPDAPDHARDAAHDLPPDGQPRRRRRRRRRRRGRRGHGQSGNGQ